MGEREVSDVSKRRGLEAPVSPKSVDWQSAKSQQDQFCDGGTPRMCDAHSLGRQGARILKKQYVNVKVGLRRK